jgi:hypothetical protein
MADTNQPGSPRRPLSYIRKNRTCGKRRNRSNPAAHQSQPRSARRFAAIQPGLNARKTGNYEGENRGALQ